MSDVWRKYKIHGKFLNEVLGGLPKNENLTKTFLATKKGLTAETLNVAEEMIRESQELATVEKQMEKSTNIFPRDENGLYLNGYQMMGALKEAMSIQRSITMWRSKIQNGVRVLPDRIYLTKNGTPITSNGDFIESVVHADTPQGPISGLCQTEILQGSPEFECELWVGKQRGVPIISDKILKNLLEHIEITGVGAKRRMCYGMLKLDWSCSEK